MNRFDSTKINKYVCVLNKLVYNPWCIITHLLNFILFVFFWKNSYNRHVVLTWFILWLNFLEKFLWHSFTGKGCPKFLIFWNKVWLILWPSIRVMFVKQCIYIYMSKQIHISWIVRPLLLYKLKNSGEKYFFLQYNSVIWMVYFEKKQGIQRHNAFIFGIIMDTTPTRSCSSSFQLPVGSSPAKRLRQQSICYFKNKN